MAATSLQMRSVAGIDLDRFPRVPLCHRPTPIEAMPRLSAELKGPQLFIKRDDCTGLAGGGNKTRKLEFLLGDALQQNADMLVTQGAIQSNHVRQTAAAASRHGLKCHALLEHRVAEPGPAYGSTSNVFLDRLFGATLEYRPSGLDMNVEAASVTERLRDAGHRPYFIPGGGSNTVGALGYVDVAQEIMRQCTEQNLRFDWLVMATGSTGTHAGLLAGFHALDVDLPVMGVSVRQPRERQMAAVHALALATTGKLDAAPIPSERTIVDDRFVGQGYGIPAPSTLEAIAMTARLEGVLLDPVYTGKGMAGLIGLVREGFFKPSDRVLFLHTGGAVALHAYEEQFEQLIS